MAYWHWGRVFLCAVLAASQETFVEQQQLALDKIAEQIRNDGEYPSCTAPQLATCGTESCSGSRCGDFYIKFTSTKEICSLFVFMKKKIVHIQLQQEKRHFPEPSVSKYDKVKFIIVTSTFHH